MLAYGVGSMNGLQALINIAVATVSVPTKGLSLPLISAGGSGLVITCAALGLLYSIARFHHDEEPAAAMPDSPEDQLLAPLAAPTAPAAAPRVVSERIWHQFTRSA
jgi:cell division protein FtsW